jgi:hypothetical protein
MTDHILARLGDGNSKIVLQVLPFEFVAAVASSELIAFPHQALKILGDVVKVTHLTANIYSLCSRP